MTYNQPLPSIRQLKKLAEWDGPFPLKKSRMVIGAERYGFDDNLIQFLELFPRNTIFHSRDDFLQRCLRLEARIKIKTEGVHSPASSRLHFKIYR